MGSVNGVDNGSSARIVTNSREEILIAKKENEGRPEIQSEQQYELVEKLGWPKANIGNIESMDFEDISADSKLEIVINSEVSYGQYHNITCLSGDGKDINGFPIKIDYIQGNPKFFDFSNLGKKQIMFFDFQNIQIFDGNGNNSKTLEISKVLDMMFCPWYVQELNNDKDPEIIIGSINPRKVVCINQEGGIKWEKISDDISAWDIMIDDISGEGNKEIIVPITGSAYQKIMVLDEKGVDVYGWPMGVNFGAQSTTYTFVANLDNTSTKQVVTNYGLNDKSYFYNYEGSLLNEKQAIWDVQFVDDLDGDGMDEIVSFNKNSNKTVIMKSDGSFNELDIPLNSNNLYINEAVDINGDGIKEIFVNTGNEIRSYNLAGEQLLSFVTDQNWSLKPFFRVSDVDHDGVIEMFVANNNYLNSELHCYEIIKKPTSVEGNTGNTDAFKLSCSPNPSSDKITINYLLPNAGKSEIVISDVLGNVVKTISNNVTEVKQSIVWEASRDNVQSGVYFIRLSAEGKTLVEKVVVSK